MRRLTKRPALPGATSRKLAAETTKILSAGDRKKEAERLFNNARKAKWFEPVTAALARMSGVAERCMFCSGSESSDVEHFWPRADYPERAMTWSNYLWACTPCNRCKSSRFPLDSTGRPVLIDPASEDVWKFFYIDRFGNLTPRFDMATNDFNFRARETLGILGLDDRQAVQEARKLRMNELTLMVKDSLARLNTGQLTEAQVRLRIKHWLKSPAQPDVADYFLNGPGRSENPFRKLFTALGSPL